MPPPPPPSSQPPSSGGTSFPNYGAPPPGYTASPGGSGVGQLAGLGVRFGGWLLDSILYGILTAVFAVPGYFLIARSLKDCVTVKQLDGASKIVCPPGSPKGGLLAAGIALVILGTIVAAVIYVIALGKTGQTWGRKIVGIKVVDKATGAPIGFGRALGRCLFERLISSSICLLGYLWAIWDKDKQTWHDKVVKSIVVKA